MFAPPVEVEALSSFGEVVSWAISAWAPPDGARSMREMVEAGLVRESNTVATGDAGIAANNHAKWYVLLGQFELASFDEFSRRRSASWRNAETEASKVTRRWFDSAGTGMEKVDQLARGLLLPAEVAAWVRDRRRSLRTPATPFRSVAVAAAVAATRDLVRGHRVFDRWMSGLRQAMIAPASWQPRWAKDIARPSLPRLGDQSLTVVSGDMGSGKSRYLRQQLARYVQNVHPADPARRTVPLLLEADQLTAVVKAADPWAAAVRAFLADHSPTLSVHERERLADLVVSRSRVGDIGMVIACDGLDELPHRTLTRLLDHASGAVTRFLQAEGASVVLGVRTGTDAEQRAIAFLESTTGASGQPIRVGALTRGELVALARAWRLPLPARRVDEYLSRHPTALLAACGLATGNTARNDSQLLESVVRRLLAGEWKDPVEIEISDLDAVFAVAADVAFAMASDREEWRYTASAAWVRRRATAVAGEAAIVALARVLPRLLQRHAHKVTWVHAAVQEFLAGWHLGNGMPADEAGEFLRRRWWQHAQWRRVTAHALACTHDAGPLLSLLASEARADPFGVLDRLLLECVRVVSVPEQVRVDALARLHSQARAIVPLAERLSNYRDVMPDGLNHVPELLQASGAGAFTGFGVADFLYPQTEFEIKHHNRPGEPIRYHPSPIFLAALRTGFPLAVHLFRQCADLVTPTIPLTHFRTDEIMTAAVPHLETTDLLLLNDPARTPRWADDARFAIVEELWARGVTTHVAELTWRPDLGSLLVNLGPAETARLLSGTCREPKPPGRCGRDELTSSVDETIVGSGTDHLAALLNEPSITTSVRIAAALQLIRGGEQIDSWLPTPDDFALVLAHRCSLSRSHEQAIELLDELLREQPFDWAADLLAEASSMAAVHALARRGRRAVARVVFDRVRAEAGSYGLPLLSILDADLDLTEAEIVDLLQRTHHSGDMADDRDRDRIHRALRRIGRDAQRAVWRYAAPDGFVRHYVEAGYVIERRMLHEVLSLDELRDAVRSATTAERAVQLLRSVLRVSPPDARTLAAEIANASWAEHRARCGSHMRCRYFAELSELFPADLRDEVAVHGDGLALIAAGRHDLIAEWRPNRTVIGQMTGHQPVAQALAAAAANDTAALERIEHLARTDDAYERALIEVNPAAGRSVTESRIAAKAVMLDEDRAYRLFVAGSPVGIDWYARAIAESRKRSLPWFTAKHRDSGTILAIMHRLLDEWLDRTDAAQRADLAAALYDAWHNGSEYLTLDAAEDIRRHLAPHAADLATSVASLATKPRRETDVRRVVSPTPGQADGGP